MTIPPKKRLNSFDDLLRMADVAPLTPGSIDALHQRIVDHAVALPQARGFDRHRSLRQYAFTGLTACAACIGIGFILGQSTLNFVQSDQDNQNLTLLMDSTLISFTGDLS